MFHAMEGQGPAFGEIVEMKLAVVSEDTVACDAAVEALMGFENLEGTLTACAHKREAGIGDMSRIDIVGEPIDKHKRSFAKASWRPTGSEGKGLEILTGDVCHGGCQMLIRYIIDASEIGFAKDAKELGPIYFLCGINPPPPPDDRFIIIYGDCAIYSTWHYDFRKSRARIGPWFKPRKAYLDVPGCCPLGLTWLKDVAYLARGYTGIYSLLDGVEIYETGEFNFGLGVPLEKNPRRWHYDPEFARRYAKEIKESNPPKYVYSNETLKGDSYKAYLEKLAKGGNK
jgi:hypothetical protein